MKCPLCEKEVKVPDELASWDPDKFDEKKMAKELEEEVQKHIDIIIEFMNHSEVTNNITKRMAILTWIIRRLLQNIFTSNYHRLGILAHLAYEIHRMVELHEINKLMQKKILPIQGNEKQKKDLTYVS